MLPTRLQVAITEWDESEHATAFRQSMDVEHAPRFWAEAERTTNVRQALWFEREGAGKTASSQPQWTSVQSLWQISSWEASPWSLCDWEQDAAWQQLWQELPPSSEPGAQCFGGAS